MSQQVEMREKQLNIRLSAEEDARLDRVAKHYGLNAAGVIRMLVKREDDAIARAELAAAAPPAPPSRPRSKKR